MMKTISAKTSVAISLLLISGQIHAIDLVASSDAAGLTNLILGSGITISNPSYTGGSTSAGSFSNGLASGIGIDQGLILTTGDIFLAQGPNTSGSAGVDLFNPGDADLDAIVGTTTFDATILEFDFVSDGGNLFFRFVFASEEYNEFVGSEFNDVFAFLLDGNDIGVIPGTTMPVTINNVNNGSFPGFYIDNEAGGFDIEYDGFTTVFTAQALNLDPGLHRMKLAIADTADGVFDSAVFIEGGTFSDIPIPAVAYLFPVGLFAGLRWMRRQNQD